MSRREFLKRAVGFSITALVFGFELNLPKLINNKVLYPPTKRQKNSKEKWLNGKIYRFAGTGIRGYSGDNGPAVNALLNGPAGLAIDKDDNIYIAEIFSSIIRKVDGITGVITTVAGCGKQGCSGDGGLAVNAELNRPEGACVDNLGNIYIADSGNQRIRKVDAKTNIITTIAGTGETGCELSDCPALNAKLNHPSGIAVDPHGSIYFNDYGNDLIKKITPSGTLRNLAGTGRPGYSGDGGPGKKACINDVYGIGIDKRGSLYFVDSLNFAVRKINTHSGKIFTVIGRGIPGPVTEFVLKDAAFLGGQAHSKGTIGSKVAHGVEADRYGNIFVAETGVNRIRMLHYVSGLYFTIAGNGEPGLPEEGASALSTGIDVHGVRIDSKGNLYYVDFIHNIVNQIRF